MKNRVYTSKTFDSAMTFLLGQLEFLDPIIHDPLHIEKYAKCLPIKTGAGAVESTSFINSSPIKGGSDKMASARSNVVKRISADIDKTNTPVYKYKAGTSYDVLELAELAKAGVNLDTIQTLALRLDYEKTVDRLAFVGDSQLGLPGLINGRSTVVPYTYNAALNGATTSRLWANKTADEILEDLDSIVRVFWANTGFTRMPNMILIDPVNFTLLTKKVNSLGNRSIWDYWMESNAAKHEGVDLQLMSSKWCSPQSAIDGIIYGGNGSSLNRMVAYINDATYTRFHLPLPLTQEGVTKIDFELRTNYFGYIGGVEIIHAETIVYQDGI